MNDAARGIEPTRIAQGRAMLLAGIRRVHTFADAPEGMPAQWEDFLRLGMPPGRVGTATYGVICSGDPQTRVLEYMTAVEVAGFDGLPAEYGRVRIFPQTYTIFLHRGHVSTIGKTWDAIWNDWLPRSGHQTAPAPDFEIYDERFDPRTGSGEIEIWVPIQAGGESGAGVGQGG